MKDEIAITNNDYWFKVIDMLQQNWALIEAAQTGCIVYFVGDTSGVFDQIEFDNVAEAKRQLRLNGFRRYAEDSKAKDFITPPAPPFHKSSHPNGAIYSSGRYWKTE
ncbi:MAG: hypothetical protein HS100_00565 [Anaerolineales bacterium]|nr:hypothetical protein [Anaerolineales bacterium]